LAGGIQVSKLTVATSAAVGQYLVHAIRKSRLFHRKQQYLLEWVGYEDLSWEDAKDVSDELRKEFKE
jgi:hypothetical protein